MRIWGIVDVGRAVPHKFRERQMQTPGLVTNLPRSSPARGSTSLPILGFVQCLASPIDKLPKVSTDRSFG